MSENEHRVFVGRPTMISPDRPPVQKGGWAGCDKGKDVNLTLDFFFGIIAKVGDCPENCQSFGTPPLPAHTPVWCERLDIKLSLSGGDEVMAREIRGNDIADLVKKTDKQPIDIKDKQKICDEILMLFTDIINKHKNTTFNANDGCSFAQLELQTARDIDKISKKFRDLILSKLQK